MIHVMHGVAYIMCCVVDRMFTAADMTLGVAGRVVLQDEFHTPPKYGKNELLLNEYLYIYSYL